jgi:hypothetical protein
VDPSSFDTIARRFAARRSRRQALAQGGAGLAAGALAAATGWVPGAAAAHAQDATPPAGAAAAGQKVRYLFVQSFQAGSIEPKAGADGTYTLKLDHGLGQTVYFSDRPERIVGATPTADFLKGFGFSPKDPPNAALVLEVGPGDEDIAVLELTNPRYDEGTKTATYDAKALADWEKTLALGFSEQPKDLARLAPAFGAAHLFIDDCPDIQLNCYDVNNPSTIVGTTMAGTCYQVWPPGCLLCENTCITCNNNLPACAGQCCGDCPGGCPSD